MSFSIPHLRQKKLYFPRGMYGENIEADEKGLFTVAAVPEGTPENSLAPWVSPSGNHIAFVSMNCSPFTDVPLSLGVQMYLKQLVKKWRKGKLR